MEEIFEHGIMDVKDGYQDQDQRTKLNLQIPSLSIPFSMDFYTNGAFRNRRVFRYDSYRNLRYKYIEFIGSVLLYIFLDNTYKWRLAIMKDYLGFGFSMRNFVGILLFGIR
ncbi:hypothetical protein AQUCO_09600038v1 [Aquilegia coerulea]|uniref:Uncharacterized protein n=1 Tax=Aquilegia coerulea TaxID=218851 RepID=A0A2G5C4N7_AQUCA|nr:hypothetical protein AQUCO_09600038v1 [Aquilegia coerulea]